MTNACSIGVTFWRSFLNLISESFFDREKGHFFEIFSNSLHLKKQALVQQ